MNRPALSLFLVLVGAVACEDVPAGPGPNTTQSLIVDARTTWVYASLAQDAVVTVADPTTSTAWDIAFFGTGVRLNGGAAGPGGVEGFCVCQNNAATDLQIVAMTPEGELADFTGTTAAAIPANAGDWETDALDPAIEGWWSYDPGSHVVSAQPATVFAMRLRGTAFAKMHVTNVQNATMSHAGTVTLEFAVQPTAADPFGTVTTLAIDLTGGPVYVDLVDGALGSSSDWDVQLSGYDMLVNGGVSGTGGVAALDLGQDFATVTTVSDIPSAAYSSGVDTYAGVFGAHPWYRYNLTGNNLIHPTFNVYLIRRGTQVWKLQLAGYYNSAGAARFITIRYEELP